MTLHSLMMSQANFFLQFKSVVNKSAELKIVKQFQTNLGPQSCPGPPQLGGLGGGCYVSACPRKRCRLFTAPCCTKNREPLVYITFSRLQAVSMRGATVASSNGFDSSRVTIASSPLKLTSKRLSQLFCK